MKVAHALASVLAASLAVGCGRRVEPAPAPAASTTSDAVCPVAGRISGAHAKKLIAEGAVLVDVRTPDEYDDKHLPGALNIAVDEIDARSGELPKDKPLVLYCQSGARAHRAATTLTKKGFAVHELGGIADWSSRDCL
jgi:phage shock protein E